MAGSRPDHLSKRGIVHQSANVIRRERPGAISNGIHDAEEAEGLMTGVDDLVRRFGSNVDGVKGRHIESVGGGDDDSLPSNRYNDMSMTVFLQAGIPTRSQLEIAKMKIGGFLPGTDENTPHGLRPIGGNVLVRSGRHALPAIVAAKCVTATLCRRRFTFGWEAGRWGVAGICIRIGEVTGDRLRGLRSVEMNRVIVHGTIVFEPAAAFKAPRGFPMGSPQERAKARPGRPLTGIGRCAALE